MASTVPAKSNNPLHNFDLPHLKWKKNHHHHSSSATNHPQRRRSTKLSSDSGSPSQSQSPMHDSVAAARHSPMRDPVPGFRSSPMRDPVAGFRRSPMRDSAVAARQAPMRDSTVAARDSPMRDPVPGFRRSPVRDSIAAARRSPMRDSVRRSPMRESVVAARQSPMRDSVTARESPMRCESERRNPRNLAAPESKNHKVQEKKHKVQEVDAGNRSKILIKIPRKNNKSEEIPEDQQPQKKSTTEEATQVADEEPKIWNLRPRKPIHKSLNLNNGVGGGPFKSGGSSIQESNKSQLPNMNTVNKPLDQANSEANKKEKRLRLSVSLSREEIDEDIYAMTGLKAARRPKKRAKVVQKQLDTLFPGLWLASITPDSYKVCENLPKG